MVNVLISLIGRLQKDASLETADASPRLHTPKGVETEMETVGQK